MLTIGSLFSGIGGLELGLERAGLGPVKWQVEIDDYCNKVLEKHWPEVKRYGDIKSIDWSEVEPVDLICGGFPCQPVSCAGKQKGDADDRWLWPEFLRAIREVRPRYALMENVPGLLSTDNGRLARKVFGDLADVGYDAEWHIVSAADVGAPHLRRRVFIVAHATRFALESDGENGCIGEARKCRIRIGSECGSPEPLAYPSQSRTRMEISGNRGWGWPTPRIFKRAMVRQENGEIGSKGLIPSCPMEDAVFEGPSWPQSVNASQLTRPDWWSVEPDVGRVANGVPSRVGRLKCLGNAVVPQVAEVVGLMIMEHEREMTEGA